MLCFFLVLLAWFFVTSLELLQSFGISFLQNAEVDLYTDILKLAIFWLKNRGSTYTQVRLIHRKIRYHTSLQPTILKLHLLRALSIALSGLANLAAVGVTTTILYLVLAILDLLYMDYPPSKKHRKQR